MFFLLLLPVAAQACLDCTLFDGTCTPGIFGMACAECSWTGWRNNLGLCITNVEPVVSPCPMVNQTAFCSSSSDAQCIPSEHGTLCQDCYYRGYLRLDDFQLVCHCYDSSASSANRCFPMIVPYSETKVLISTESRITCSPFQDKTLGCFNNSRECCSPILGPPPGQLVESGLLEWQECNTFGSHDPNEPVQVSTFRTCSGHGDWNTDSYACTCHEAWNALDIGSSPFEPSVRVYSCRTCFGFWGPPPPLTQTSEEVPVLFCSVPWTPNEEGVSVECSGHGEYLDGKCVCHQNPTQGFWEPRAMTSTFTRVSGEGVEEAEPVTVLTCTACSSGASGPRCLKQGMKVQVANSLPPAPAACKGCYTFKKALMTDVVLIEPLTVPPSPTCCSALQVTVEPSFHTITVGAGTCLESDDSKHHLGSVWCASLNCSIYMWSNEDRNVLFSFSKNRIFTQIVSAKHGLGRACPKTASPQVPPTLFPTQYPTIQ